MTRRNAPLLALSLLTSLALLASACGAPPAQTGEEQPPPQNPPAQSPDAGGSNNQPPPPPPALTASAGQPQAVCAGSEVVLSGTASGGVPPYAFRWSAASECPGCIEDDPAAPVVRVIPQLPTTFRLQVTDSVGTTATSDVAVDAYALPRPAAFTDQFVQPGEGAILNGTLEGATPQWSCNRDDCALSDALAPQPTATPALSTTYTLHLTDAHGCSTDTSTTVWVDLLVSSSLPADGTDGWPVSSLLMVELDQALRAESVNAQTVLLHEASSGNAIPAEVTLGGDGHALYIKPGDGYVAGAAYTLTLVGGAGGLLSDDPVLPNRLRQDVTVAFTTGGVDHSPPTIVSMVPLPDQTNVARDTAVVATFREQVDPRTVNATTVRLSDASGDVAGALVYDAETHSVRFQPSQLLAEGGVYTVSIDGVADLSGNTVHRTWSFTVGGIVDEVPPQVRTIEPADGATDVSVNARVRVTFDELVDPDSLGGLVVTNVSTGEAVPGTVSYSFDSLTATWTPSHFLQGLTAYQVSVSGVRDLAGNPLASPSSATFTTRQLRFGDDFEAGATSWLVTGTWAPVAGLSYNGSACLSDSPDGNYSPNTSTEVSLLAPVDVSGASTVTVDFWRRMRTLKHGELFALDYRLTTGGVTGDWTEAASYSGNSPWRLESLTLDTGGASSLELRLRFSSDAQRERDGVLVDEVLVQTP